MGKSLRLSEKWFNRGLWLLALVFAGFLIGLGGTLVGDLPQVERQQGLEDFMDPAATATARADQRQANQARRAAQDALDQAQLQQAAAARSPALSASRARLRAISSASCSGRWVVWRVASQLSKVSRLAV